MEEYKDTGIEWIGNIPNNWTVTRLKYLVNCYDGKRIPIDAGLRECGEYPYWGAGSITDYVNDYIFDEELVLLGEDGAPFFDKNRPVAFLVNEKIWVNNHIHVLKAQNDVTNRFLTYYLNIVEYKEYINGSVLNKLTQSNMNNINIAFPSIKEQNDIADFLDRKISIIDSILDGLNKQITILDNYKKSLITETITKGLNNNAEMKESGIDWIGKIAKNAKLIKLKYFSDMKDRIV